MSKAATRGIVTGKTNGSDPPLILCVVGMHRSGTSLVTRALNLAGLHVAPEEHLMQPTEHNPTGFWEHQLLTDLDDEILGRFGGSWDAPPELPPGWEASDELADLRERALGVLASDFGGVAQWAWKDPRNCLTLPFWQALLPPMQYVVCLRNPADVARSLEDRVPFERGAGLWLAYVHSALLHTSGGPRAIVFYEDAMADWRRALAPVFRLAGVEEAVAAPDIQRAIDEYVAAGLWHHRTRPVSVVQERRVPFAARALYLALRLRHGDAAAGAEPELDPAIDQFALEAARAGQEMALVAREAERLRQEAVERDRVVETVEAELAARVEESTRARVETARSAEELERERAELKRLVDELRVEQVAAQRARERELELERANASLRGRLDDAKRERRRLRRTIGEQTRGLGELSKRVEVLGELVLQRQDAVAERSQELDRADTAQLADMHFQSYETVLGRVQEIAQRVLPVGASVAVISRGDERLLQLGPRRALHFPQLQNGVYAGSYPADSAGAIAHLDELRAKGAQYLLIPSTAFWWLDYYDEFRHHLEQRCEVVTTEDACVIYALGAPVVHAPTPAAPDAPREEPPLDGQLADLLRAILPSGVPVLILANGEVAAGELEDRPLWSIPITTNGAHATGATAAELLAAVEERREAGAGFAVWAAHAETKSERNAEVRRYLEERYRVVTRQANVCTVFDLRATSDPGSRAGAGVAGYPQLVEAIRRVVRSTVPPGATVAVVSRGDSELVTLTGRRGWHFPREPGGEWAGYHPADSEDAIRQLDALRAGGAQFLVLPAPAFWWLEHYGDFAADLAARDRLIWSDQRCRVYALGALGDATRTPLPTRLERVLRATARGRFRSTRGA